MIEILITAGVCFACFVAAIRHAKKKPSGIVAKGLNQIAGGGGGPGVPDEK